MKSFDNAYRGRRVLVTGHTGFKGSWLAAWLHRLGAEVTGLSLDIPTTPSHFQALGLADLIRHCVGDIRDRAALAKALDDSRPEIVFHLAAQPLVRRSYAEPALTFETNALGTLNILECVRTRPSIRAAVLITSDKAYRNDEWCWGYRETDALGGRDPYSGSKACAELIAYSYYHSFFKNSDTRIVTTRAGNVIGGGDWAADRIVPDCVRAWASEQSVMVRNPRATRPWQHVLEPLSGYLSAGASLLADPTLNGESFNFGPNANDNHDVGQLIQAMATRWPGAQWHSPEGSPAKEHEAGLLKLSCDKALSHLKWHAALTFQETVEFTVDWYRAWRDLNGAMFDYTGSQIETYSELAARRHLAWAQP